MTTPQATPEMIEVSLLEKVIGALNIITAEQTELDTAKLVAADTLIEISRQTGRPLQEIEALTDGLAQGGERERIVAWLRKEAARWHSKVQGYRKKGNNGPYLGEPSGWDFASRIERGEHVTEPPLDKLQRLGQEFDQPTTDSAQLVERVDYILSAESATEFLQRKAHLTRHDVRCILAALKKDGGE